MGEKKAFFFFFRFLLPRRHATNLLHQVITYDPSLISAPPYTLDIVSTPPLFARAARIRSRLTIRPDPAAPAAACVQTLTGTVEFRLGLGLGKLIEGGRRKVGIATPTLKKP